MNRFDFDQTSRDLLNNAVELGVTDAIGLACLVGHAVALLPPGTDPSKSVNTILSYVLAELDEYAEADRHNDPALRSAWIKLRDEEFVKRTQRLGRLPN